MHLMTDETPNRQGKTYVSNTAAVGRLYSHRQNLTEIIEQYTMIGCGNIDNNICIWWPVEQQIGKEKKTNSTPQSTCQSCTGVKSKQINLSQLCKLINNAYIHHVPTVGTDALHDDCQFYSNTTFVDLSLFGNYRGNANFFLSHSSNLDRASLRRFLNTSEKLSQF